MTKRFDARPIGAAALAALLLAGIAVVPIEASAQSLSSAGTVAVPTYEAVGLYWDNPGGTAGCDVRYRAKGQSAWSEGLRLWYDARDAQCRGSLVNLAAGTEYEVQLGLPGQAPTRGLTFRTWSNRFPVARTIQVSSGSATLNVTQGGSPSGYVVYEGNGATLDGGNSTTHNITINASYVIVRGFKLRGARQDAIRLSPNVHDVVIEDNDISGWGRQRSGNWGVDMDSAIRAVCTSPTLQRVTIQRNRIHDPRYSANSWSDGHPAGPQAVAFAHCGGNHVIRHNEVYSTNGNYFNDIIGGEDNFTKAGFPNSDTDIYGNRLTHAWDDAIEAEGANENVRIWGNYIDRTAIGIATTATSVGPAYIFRNVWNRAQMKENIASLDQDDRQPFFKSGGKSDLGHGRRYVFHNTMLQAQQPGLQYGLGGGYGMGGTGSAQLIENTWSRNNIFHLWKPGKSAFYQAGPTSSAAHDMYNGTMGDMTIVNGINATPRYRAGHGWTSEAGGNYQLERSTPGYDGGERIPNFNDGYTGAAPDVGAHEADTAAMRFGIAASPGSSISAPGSTTPPPTTPPPATTSHTLSVGRSGAGTVVSAPAGIQCGSTCSATYAAGTAVTLTATPASGNAFAGWSGACSGSGSSCTVTMNAAASVTASFNAASSPSGTVALNRTVLAFSGSAPASQTVTYTNNTGSRVTFIRASTTSARFQQSNNCGDVPAGGSCTATVTYHPGNSGADSATFTMTSTAPNSPHVVTLTHGTAPAASLVGHFYRTILRREPDASGKAHWDAEVARVTGMSVNASEVWYAMAGSFFTSAEYANLRRDNTGFVTDLYAAFFDRIPDATGRTYWENQLAGGLPRQVVMTSFMFSQEFASLAGGGKSARVEMDVVLDFYRGLLGRIPDTAGFNYWLKRFRAAQCRGYNAVMAEMDGMSREFTALPEFSARAAASDAFVSSLYNALLRRGGDLQGVRTWTQRVQAGGSRDEVRRAFVYSPEFMQRVDQMARAGCLN